MENKSTLRSLVGVGLISFAAGGFVWVMNRSRQGSADAESPILQKMLDVWSAIRAQQDLYQSLHWRASGTSAYGDHLLYERLYKGRLEELDQVAERIAGLFGSDALAPASLGGRVAAWMERWTQASSPVQQAIASEKDVQAALRQAYDTGRSSGGLTLGLDDLLMSLASAHEEAAYLLGQRAKGSPNRGGGLAQAVRMAKDAWEHSGAGVRVRAGKGAIIVQVEPHATHMTFPASAWGYPVRVQ